MSADDNLPTPSDNRTSPRKPIIKMVQVLFDQEFCIECVALDISDEGVRLCHHTPIIIPDFITVRLPSGKALPGRVLWRSADTFGVVFVK